jgi:hypothetical protein
VDPRQRLELIEQREGAKLRKLLGESLPALVRSAEPLDRKVIRLRQIVDKSRPLSRHRHRAARGAAPAATRRQS